MQGTSKGEVTSVSEWCDDESHSVTKVFVLVGELRVHRLNVQVIIMPVVPEATNNYSTHPGVSSHSLVTEAGVIRKAQLYACQQYY